VRAHRPTSPRIFPAGLSIPLDPWSSWKGASGAGISCSQAKSRQQGFPLGFILALRGPVSCSIHWSSSDFSIEVCFAAIFSFRVFVSLALDPSARRLQKVEPSRLSAFSFSIVGELL
jgi:hypothetical protein